MQNYFTPLEIGQSYEKDFLAKLWGYKSHYAIDRGVVTPADTNYIILFVTKIKQKSSTQYKDFIDEDRLFWEGETKHGADQRIVAAKSNYDEIHLFYREIHHTPFVYFGRIRLIGYELRSDLPSKFEFKIDAFETEPDASKEINEHAGEFKTLSETEQQSIRKSRLGQGVFRTNLIKLWGSCSITSLPDMALLKASHLKPWKDSSNSERLNPYNGLLVIPTYDLLLDKGLISFNTNGRVIISKRLGIFGQKIFHVDKALKLRKFFPENKEFLEYHRDEVFK